MKYYQDLHSIAEVQIKETLAALPEALRTAAGIPVILEKHPSEKNVEEGIDADVLGLFVGPSLADFGAGYSGEAPHIILFLGNIWDEAEEDRDRFCAEVKITLLHELGHYLNLDEDDLEDRGLG